MMLGTVMLHGITCLINNRKLMLGLEKGDAGQGHRDWHCLRINVKYVKDLENPQGLHAEAAAQAVALENMT
jgi:hypothetical protein